MKKMLSVFVVAMMCLVGSVSAEAANWISGNSDGSRLWDADSVYSKKNGDIFFYEKGIDTAVIAEISGLTEEQIQNL